MNYVLRLLQNQKEEHEALVEFTEKHLEKGTYRTTDEIAQAKKSVAKYKDILDEINASIEKLLSQG